MLILALSLGVVLASLSWGVTFFREREHQYAALLFTWFAVGDISQYLIYSYLTDIPRPYTGASEGLLHLAHFFMFSREYAFTAAVLWYFRSNGALATLQLGTVAYVVTLDYPRFSGETLKLYYLIVTVILQSVSLLFGISRILTYRVKPQTAHFSLLLWSVLTVFLIGNRLAFMNNWNITVAAATVCALASIFVHIHRLLRSSPWTWNHS